MSGKETAALFAGAFVGSRIGNWLIPFLFIACILAFVFGGAQCVYHVVTGAPALIEPQIDPEFQHESN